MPQNSQSLDKVLTLASLKAAAIGTKDVNVACLVVAVAAESTSRGHTLLLEAGLTADVLERTARNLFGSPQAGGGTATLTQPEVGRDAQEMLVKAGEVAEKNKHIYTTPTHLLHQLVKHPDGQRVIKSAFLTMERRGGANPITLPNGTQTDGNLTPEQRLKNLTSFLDGVVKTNVNGLPEGEGAMTTMLDQMTVDLTKLARENKLSPIIGRKKEIRRAIEILGRQTKNNPVFIGEPGVGKTAIAEGLAVEIAFDRVPKPLKNKRVLRLDLVKLVAGTKFRGEFEERMKQILEELMLTKDCIVFIDEMHTLIGAGAAQGAMDASNTLKPALARGEITAIGATTLDEYRHIEKDGALERRFQPVMVEPSSVEDTIEILRGRKKSLEDHHAVTISDDAIVAAAHAADRYITDRFLPDKAIDVIDEACSALAIDDPGTELKVEHINSKISQMTGIKLDKISQDEAKRLSKMEEALHERVIGQHMAISAVSRAVRRSRAGLKDPNTPIGSFLFLGPTGVGKTELTKALQAFLFDDERTIVRLDMSEYMEKHSVARMIGAPPGYVGYEEGGTLTETVRRKPYSVVLLDEIEKAHPDVFNVLLQVLDDGRLTDGQGRTVNFRNTIIIMTSNIGADRIMALLEKLGSDCSHEDLLNEVMPLVKLMFRPEFLNRLDEVVCFGQLTRDELKEVLKLQLNLLLKRIDAAHKLTMDLSADAREVILAAGYDPQFGARPMKRAVRRLLEDPMSEKIIDGTIKRGGAITVEAEGNLLVLSAKNPSQVSLAKPGAVSLSKDGAENAPEKGEGDDNGSTSNGDAVSLKKD